MKNEEQFRDRIISQHEYGLRINSITCDPSSSYIGSKLSININFSANNAQAGIKLGISIENSFGQRITSSYMGKEGLEINIPEGDHNAMIEFSNILLTPGDYYVTAAIHLKNGEICDSLEKVASFKIHASDMTNSGNLVDEHNGIVWIDHKWYFSERITL